MNRRKWRRRRHERVSVGMRFRWWYEANRRKIPSVIAVVLVLLLLGIFLPLMLSQCGTTRDSHVAIPTVTPWVLPVPTIAPTPTATSVPLLEQLFSPNPYRDLR